ncbi:6e21345c-be3f-4236-ac5d-3d1ff3a6eee3 [Thermothielavioides terrestris]|uniref:6e21345c-be3f-4236-ac5d-3d1ff3a6eee3 n=1 Tax=Thermothielavioides terrestris TaxID=2587410 RepID=A0A446BJC0_9PEZI|nr:6e21345c-be3f-4236-ac5d-3d1ff3a6eee3 [Thermothielavioides terrestris]
MTLPANNPGLLDEDADGAACGPSSSCSPTAAGTLLSTTLALAPLLVTFLLVSSLALSRLFPRLARLQQQHNPAQSSFSSSSPAADIPIDDGNDHFLPASAPPSLRQAHAELAARSPRRRLAAAAFAATLGLSAVLAELILAEVWEVEGVVLGRAARAVGLRVTVPGLVVMLVAVLPFLEVHSVLASRGWRFGRDAKGRLVSRAAWVVLGVVFAGWLAAFCVSSPWHTFVDDRIYRKRPITDADIARKQAGLDATSELLLTKRHRLRSLQRKAQAVAAGVGGGTPHGAAPPASGLVSKVIGSLKSMAGSGEAAEIKALQVEISGLETMESNLAASLSLLKSRQAAHARDGTALGRLLAVPRYIFASYCIYRVLATILTTVHRIYRPSASFSSSDPINRFLGLLAKHWDPKLDQIAWARQISFLLSGVILAASANSVLQTFRLFAKWAPGLLYQAQANLALLVGQVAATYVISSALLLRSNLPRDVGRSVGDALESALEPGFVDRWFEGWFLLASVGTAAGIWVGRKVGGGGGGGLGDEWDEFAGEEMGQKRS